jgi:aldose sugar dehydrogenase
VSARINGKILSTHEELTSGRRATRQPEALMIRETKHAAAKCVNSFPGSRATLATVLVAVLTGSYHLSDTIAQESGPTMLDPNLGVRIEVGDLITPVSAAFFGPTGMLVLERNTGKVQRIVNGRVHSTALDLAVNFASERGLLGIALHPNFPANPGVYLYWTCRASVAQDSNPFRPEQRECADVPALGPDSDNLLDVPMLGNRVDRFRWDGATLTFDRNVIKLLAFQHDGAPEPLGQGDEAQPARANHNGGVIAFGPDGKLYVLIGDVGRRSQLQNLPSGPTATGLGPTVPDDLFGGPQADAAHFSGVILRLNEDGTIPPDNPFARPGAPVDEIDANIQRVFAYGIRNSFGMAFDPLSGSLWDQENGEDAFDELNRVEAGMNSGWIQFMGPMSRVAEYKQIETTALHHEDFPNLQQFRWAPARIANTPSEALARLFTLPRAIYSDPEFSWKHVLAPAGIGFLNSRELGAEFFGDLFVGFSVPEPLGGPLFRFRLTGDRRNIAVDDPRLADGVADNGDFHELTESESLIIGRDFGIVTDIKTGPHGHLFVVSIDRGTVYEIFRRSR